jgi:hypothetical protein
VISISPHSVKLRMLVEAPVASARPAYGSETRADIALLVCALFLQRFGLTFGDKSLALNLIPAVFVLWHQFLSGKLLIQFDRLFWFLATALVATCSLLLNFESTMLTSYSIFVVLYSLLILGRPSTPERYDSTLRAFQVLVLIISCLAVLQFVAQFVVDGRQLIKFYGMVPDFLLGPSYEVAGPGVEGMHTIIPITYGSSILKSNGIFLNEPSGLSQITALGILIEVLEFRRPRYLLVMALGLLMSYSGTGVMLLLLSLPLLGLRDSRAALSAILVMVFALGLFATGIIDSSLFLGRVGEFEDTHQSGFQRFVAPFWLAAQHFDTASLLKLLVGNGPGSEKMVASATWYGGHGVTWIKLLIEYGIIGSFTFICFLAACFRKTICPRLLVPAMFFYYFFIDGMFLNPSFVTVAIILCTLHVYEPRRGGTGDTSLYRPPFAAGSGAG